MSNRQDQRLENAMGRMLQIGVSVAALVVFFGGVLYLKQSHGPMPDYHRFHQTSPGFETVNAIIAGVIHMDSRSLIELGILLLIATPVCRVIFGVVGFAIEKDRLYTGVSVSVLVILMWSFFTRR